MKILWPLLTFLCLGNSAHASLSKVTDSLALRQAMAAGFLDAHMESEVLVRGQLFSFGSLVIQSKTGFTLAQMGLLEFIGIPATAANLHRISKKVRSFLLNCGHPFAQFRFDFKTRDGQASLELLISIEADEGFKYGGFKYSGSRIRSEPLERLALLKFGETYSEDRLLLAHERLARTGYFESVVPGPMYRDSSRNLLYPTLALADFQGNHLSGILGYDSERSRKSAVTAKKGGNGINGYLDIHLINIRGTARDLDFNFESQQVGDGTDSRDAHVAFTEPWIFGLSVGAKLAAHITLEDSVYDEGSYGIEFFKELDFHSRYMVALARQFNRDYTALTQSTAEIAGLGFLYDARDQVPSTLKGFRYSLRLNGVHRNINDSSYFLVQSLNEFSLWGNLGRWVGHAKLTGSGNWPLSRQANRGDLYSIGGANSIRGYREKEFLTNLFLYGNFEIQFLLAPRSRASLFVVPALVNRLKGDINWQREIGYGFGLDSGAKDWTFGISYALNPTRTIGNGFVHMRVTNNF